MSLTVYHNPRCRKSREVVQYLEELKIPFEIIKYHQQVFDKKTLQEILNKTKMKPSDILRKNEILWKKEFSPKKPSEEQILKLLVEHPNLIERPIVTHSTSGVLARPLGNLIEFLHNH